MKNVNQLLGYQKFAKLMTQVQSLDRLNDTLVALLPPALRAEVSCAKLEQGTLTLLASNGGYATQVRFSSQALIAGLNEALRDQSIQKIRCIVRPTEKPKKKEVRKRRQISQSASEIICATAATISDEKLRAIWERLGSTK